MGCGGAKHVSREEALTIRSRNTPPWETLSLKETNKLSVGKQSNTRTHTRTGEPSILQWLSWRHGQPEVWILEFHQDSPHGSRGPNTWAHEQEAAQEVEQFGLEPAPAWGSVSAGGS